MQECPVVLLNPTDYLDTFTADDAYFCHNMENLLLPAQIQLSKKPKIFCSFFIALLLHFFI